MKTTTASLCVLSIITFTAASCGGGASPPAAEAQDAVRYHCPMHPSIVQDGKGECPICGMDLVLVPAAARAKDAGRRVEGSPARAAVSSSPPGALAVNAEQQRVIGITVGEVERSAGARTLRLLGRVTPDETRVYRVNAGVAGSIRDVSGVTAGDRVRRDQILASFYGPEAFPAIQLFITGLAGREYAARRQAEGSVEGEATPLANLNIQQRVVQLENYGVSALQREEISRARRIPDTIWVVAPADGVVLTRNVTPGLKFERGEELYRIADLRRVWVLADVFLQDARHVRPGMKATVSVPEQDIVVPAKVAEILPQLDGTTRTLKVKLVVDNPRQMLRPDLFVDVGLSVELPSGIAVPADAILDTGLAKTVFVQPEPGVFVPRRVETGWRSGDQVEIVKGLSPGEVIVTSGTFFLDSETRIRASSSGAAVPTGSAPDPTGHAHPHGGAGVVPKPAPDGAREEGIHAHAGDAR